MLISYKSITKTIALAALLALHQEADADIFILNATSKEQSATVTLKSSYATMIETKVLQPNEQWYIHTDEYMSQIILKTSSTTNGSSSTLGDNKRYTITENKESRLQIITEDIPQEGLFHCCWGCFGFCHQESPEDQQTEEAPSRYNQGKIHPDTPSTSQHK